MGTETKTETVKAQDVKSGMMVDLEGDPFTVGDVQWEYEYGKVYRIWFAPVPGVGGGSAAWIEFTDGSLILFPRDHELKVVRRDA